MSAVRPREDRWRRLCASRFRYDSSAAAQDAVVRASRKWGIEMVWSTCALCAGYHLARRS